jgi:hypothetical protein
MRNPTPVLTATTETHHVKDTLAMKRTHRLAAALGAAALSTCTAFGVVTAGPANAMPVFPLPEPCAGGQCAGHGHPFSVAPTNPTPDCENGMCGTRGPRGIIGGILGGLFGGGVLPDEHKRVGY